MSESFWNKKRVLITGHTGFKGAWLAIRLVSFGAKVTGLSLNQDEPKTIYNAAKISKKIDEFFFDICDEANFDSIFSKLEFDIIFHFAAQSLVLDSYLEPLKTYKTNVIGTLNVLEFFRRSSAKALIVVTSDKCYENIEQSHCYVESDPMGGYDLYSSSKGCVELLVSSYRRSFLKSDKGVATVRSGNAIGGGDFAKNRIVPDCIKAIDSKQEILIRNPNSVRPFQHVMEPLDGYLTLAERLYSSPNDYQGGWNFGPDSSVKVCDLAEKIVKAYGAGNIVYVDNPNTPHEAKLLMLNCDKAKKFLGWKPILSIDDAVELTVQWYKNSYIDPFELTLKQYEFYDSKKGMYG